MSELPPLRRMLRAALLPGRALAVLGASQSFVDNPVLGSRTLNRWGLHRARVAWAQRMAGWRRALLTAGTTAEDRAAFARDGCLVKRDWLPPEAYARMRDELLETPLPAREHAQGDAMSRLVPLEPGLLRRLPATAAFLASPGWRGLLAHIGATPTPPLVFLQTVFPRWRPEQPDPQQALHSDTFYPSAKAWFFLTDVTEADGPFRYVPGSHRATPARLAQEQARSLSWREADRLSQRGSFRATPEDCAGLGLGPPMAYAVPANTLVMADTNGLHARAPGEAGRVRVAIYAQVRGTPFLPLPLPSPRLLLGGREAALGLRVLDGLAGVGLVHQHWVPVGLCRAADPPRLAAGDVQ